MCFRSLSYFILICVITPCDKGNAKPFEAPNERLGVSGRLVSWGDLSSAPSGLRLCINYVKLPVRRRLQAPLPVHSLYGTRSSHFCTCKSIREGKKKASNIFVLALLRGPALDTQAKMSMMCVDASIQGSLFGHDVSTPHSAPVQVPLDRTPKNEPRKKGGSEEKKRANRQMGVCITAVGETSHNLILLGYKHSIFEIGIGASMGLGYFQKCSIVSLYKSPRQHCGYMQSILHRSPLCHTCR